MSAPMTPERLAEIRERYDAPHDPNVCGKNCWHLAHKDVPALLAEVERLRAELDARCDKDGCEQYREWLSGEKAEADKRARQAETERDAVRAELATVLNNYAALQAEAITLEGERDEARIEAGQLRAALAEERARHGELVAEMQRARKAADDARAEQVRLAEQVKRVRDRHPRKTDDADCMDADTTLGCQHGPGYHVVEYCGTCDDEWPCAEIRALDGTEGGCD